MSHKKLRRKGKEEGRTFANSRRSSSLKTGEVLHGGIQKYRREGERERRRAQKEPKQCQKPLTGRFMSAKTGGMPRGDGEVSAMLGTSGKTIGKKHSP